MEHLSSNYWYLLSLPVFYIFFLYSRKYLYKNKNNIKKQNILYRITNEPNNHIINSNNIQNNLKIGFYDVQGKRKTMEDAHTIEINLCNTNGDKNSICTFLGIYDGHGGRRAADYVASNLAIKCIDNKKFIKGPQDSLRQAILEIEQEFIELSCNNDWNDGTTLVIAIIKDNFLTVANVGDSECIISSNHKPFILSEIHNPEKNEDEIIRVKNAGGRIFQNRLGHPYLNVNYFNLGISRAIGDNVYKDKKYTNGNPSGLIAEPHIISMNLDFKEDDFIILACDGLWDVFSYQNAINFIWDQLQLSDDLNEIAKNLVNEALRLGSNDNISVIIATWKDFI